MSPVSMKSYLHLDEAPGTGTQKDASSPGKGSMTSATQQLSLQLRQILMVPIPGQSVVP